MTPVPAPISSKVGGSFPEGKAFRMAWAMAAATSGG